MHAVEMYFCRLAVSNTHRYTASPRLFFPNFCSDHNINKKVLNPSRSLQKRIGLNFGIARMVLATVAELKEKRRTDFVPLIILSSIFF